MKVSEAWSRIINGLGEAPVELSTPPKLRSIQKWFFAQPCGLCILIEKSRDNQPSISFETKKIGYGLFKIIFPYYFKRERIPGLKSENEELEECIFALIRHFCYNNINDNENQLDE